MANQTKSSCVYSRHHRASNTTPFLLSDLSEFKLVAESVSIGGVMCQQWQYVFTVNTKVNTYNFY